MPFGPKCEFEDFESCVAALRGKVDDPEAACGYLQHDFPCEGESPDPALQKSCEAADTHFAEWAQIIPRAGRPNAFALDAHQVDGTAGQKLTRYHWRFYSPKIKACWGFTTLGLPETPGARVLAIAKGPISPRWITGEVTHPEFVRKASGRYRVSLAAENFVEIFARAGDGMNGRFTFSKHATAGWICTRGATDASILAGMELGGMLRELKVRRFQKALVPRDTLDLSMGLRLIDLPREHSRTVSVRGIVKQASEQRYTLGIAYPVKEVDAHGEYATAEEVEKAAWRYMQNRKVGLMHRDGTQGAGSLVESYIYRGPKWEHEGQTVDPGDWLIGVVWEQAAWDLIKSGTLQGFSIQGWARKPS